MKIERQFFLAAPVGVVWDALKDSHLMAQCLPGAELETITDTETLRGQLKVRLGPIAAVFHGTVALCRDSATYTGNMDARGVDKRTNTRVRADIGYRLATMDEGTQISIVCELALMGMLAQFARRNLIEKISAELIEGFSTNLEQRLNT